MTDLVVLMLTSMAMAWCADHVVWKRESVKKGHRMAVFSVVITVIMAGFAGLRTRCNDTGAYKHGYELITEGSLENIDINIGSNPLFNVVFWIVYHKREEYIYFKNILKNRILATIKRKLH